MLHTLPRERAIDIPRPAYFRVQPLSYAHSHGTATRVPRNCVGGLTTVTNDGRNHGSHEKPIAISPAARRTNIDSAGRARGHRGGAQRRSPPFAAACSA